MIQPEIKVVPDLAAIAAEAASRIVHLADEHLTLDGRFSLVLSGGSTPKALYQLLAAEPYRSRLDWKNVDFFFGDERCVPPDHPDSNFRMASEALFKPLSIPAGQIQRMKGEIDPETAAIEYGQMLKSRFGDGGPDLILLGMGDDGHTASLFPGTTALAETHHRCVANHVEKLNAWRITMSAPFINRARQVMILAGGSAKAARLAEVLEGTPDPNRLPVQLIQPASGKLTWIIDVAAAGM
jgi:6-phosphogluconolactonase